MSAIASAETGVASTTLAVHEGSAGALELEASEQRRWMLWFGLPAAVSAFFVAMVFATGHAFFLGLAIVAFVIDVGVLIWLAMSSDTNAVIGAPAGSHH